jgi:HK97 family phage portal protein
MPVLDRVLNRFGLARMNGHGRKQNAPIINDERGNRPSVQIIGGFTGTGGSWGTWNTYDYVPQVTAGYIRNPDVYACVSLIASAGKQVKWWDGAGNSKALTPAELLAKAIGRDPDEHMAPSVRDDAKQRRHYLKAVLNPLPSIALLRKAGGAAFIESWLSYILLAGNDYIEIERTAPSAPPNSIYLLRPDRVQAWLWEIQRRGIESVFAVENELVEYWKVTAYGQARTVPPRDMVHSKLFNPLSDIYGMPPLQAAMLRVQTLNEGAERMKLMMQRGFAPGWIEAAKDSIWDDVQIAQLKERVRASKGAGEELFLENATWHQMGFSPADSEVSNQQILSKRDIAAVFHVPPELIGDTASKTYSNFQEARRALYTEAVIPLLTQFRDDWNQTIGKELGSPLDFDKDTFDAISAARAEATDRVNKLWSSGVITHNEARADLEYDSVEKATGGDGNVFYAPANFMPLSVPPDEEGNDAPAKQPASEDQQ